jgi:hypothetical protein
LFQNVPWCSPTRRGAPARCARYSAPPLARGLGFTKLLHRSLALADEFRVFVPHLLQHAKAEEFLGSDVIEPDAHARLAGRELQREYAIEQQWAVLGLTTGDEDFEDRP